MRDHFALEYKPNGTKKQKDLKAAYKQLNDYREEHGNPSHIKIARGIGMGLDEKAIEAVRQYKFKPAMLNGKPVKVDLYIDVDFRIF